MPVEVHFQGGCTAIKMRKQYLEYFPSFFGFTLLPLLKHVIIVLSADDNCEGGVTFALYALLCRHSKLNQQAFHEELSTDYNHGHLN
uniref:Uncharacterized protein n=1 Tax=Nelumbo nucifera TaxID=4432 RepID=A0A822XHF0_NELNU|nr:TPA_asm: hypothetical protein HUJ06_020556 [Nelumbo nucifera]